MKVKNETIVITDPCYMKSSFPEMKRNTIYGDWSCMVYPGTIENNNLPNQWNEKYFKFFYDYNSEKDPDKKQKLSDEYNEFKKNWLKENCLGEFCADGGDVAVFIYDNLSNRDQDWLKEHPWCATVISDFTGSIDFVVNKDEVYVVGSGEKSFFSVQSEF